MFNFYIKNKIKNNLKEYSNIIVWGTGGLADLAIENWLPKKKIKYIIDPYNQECSYKKKYDIYRPDKIHNNENDLIVICSSAYLEIIEYINKNNISCNYIYIYELFLKGCDKNNEISNLFIDILAVKNCNFFKLVFIRPQILINITFRLSKHFKKYKIFIPFYWLFSFLHYLFCAIISIQLPLKVKAGPGLIFAHPGTIVFTPRAKLGSFVTIYHCCTIGTTLSGKDPSIGDFVTIYTGSHILGGTKLGNHSRVGAISLLLDFQGDNYSTIAGIPAETKKKYLFDHSD